MKTLPIGFAFDFAVTAKPIYDKLQLRSPLRIQNEAYSSEHMEIDDLVGEYFGISRYSASIREALVDRVDLRESRSRQRR